MSDLRVSETRFEEHGDDALTGIFIRAQDGAGRWHSVDIAVLDRPSLIEFVTSRGEVSEWAQGIILHLLGWPMSEETATPREGS